MLQEPVVFEDRPYEMTVSVGIVESTVGFIETEQQLIQRARIAMEHAKHEGGNRTVTWAELIDAQPKRGGLDQLTIQGVSHRIERIRQQLRCTYVESTRALVAAVEAKDPYTRGHSESVARYASLIARALSVTGDDLEGVRVAGILHDIGKLILDSTLLSKTTDLEPYEWELIREHPKVGARILKPAVLPWPVVPLVYHHHERYDGSGYPDGLKGDDIPLGARILAVADSFDAMNSDRSYRPRLSQREILRILEDGAGQLFDPEIVRAFLTLVKKDLISA